VARVLRAPWALVLPAALLVLWHLTVEYRWVAEGIIPSPAQVLRSWEVWIFGATKGGLSPYSGTWLDNVLYSSKRVLQGFGLAALVAIPLGLMIGWNRLTGRLVDPTIQLLRPVPITAWLPFAIAVFGIYDASALFLIGMGAFYPIVVNTTHGVRDLDDDRLSNLIERVSEKRLGLNRIAQCGACAMALHQIHIGRTQPRVGQCGPHHPLLRRPIRGRQPVGRAILVDR